MAWLPHTGNISSASIDWCETNYQITPYIVQFWNTLSSFTFAIFSCYGIYTSYKIKGPVIERMICIALCIVGLGSVAFHGTLKYPAQMMDQLPMLWCMSLQISGRYHYSHLTLFDYWYQRRKRLKIFYAFYNIFWLVSHINNAFVVFFQLNFVLISLLFCAINSYVQAKFGDKESAFLFKLYVGTGVVAFIAWLVDTNFCSQVKEVTKLEFHAIWHLLCAYSCHAAILLGVYIRNSKDKNLEVERNLILGIKPKVYSN